MPDGRYFSRRELLATTGAGTAAGLTGCLDGLGGGGGNGNGGNGNGGQDPADLPPVHFLTDYNNDPWQKKWEETLIPQFKEDTGIGVDIEYSGFSGGGQENRLATLLQSGDPPALSTGTMVQVGDMYAGDQLGPTTGVVDAIQETAGDFVSQPYRDFNGDTWQIPHGYYTSVLHYREDVYEELGLEVPTSFAGLRENAKAIDESDMDIRGYGMPGQKTGKSKDEFNVHLANAGAALLRAADPDADQPETELWFPEEETLTILEHFQELAEYSTDPTGIATIDSTITTAKNTALNLLNAPVMVHCWFTLNHIVTILNNFVFFRPFFDG
jgi:multiple sugar transport system substrate-binding protein